MHRQEQRRNGKLCRTRSVAAATATERSSSGNEDHSALDSPLGSLPAAQANKGVKPCRKKMKRNGGAFGLAAPEKKVEARESDSGNFLWAVALGESRGARQFWEAVPRDPSGSQLVGCTCWCPNPVIPFVHQIGWRFLAARHKLQRRSRSELRWWGAGSENPGLIALTNSFLCKCFVNLLDHHSALATPPSITVSLLLALPF